MKSKTTTQESLLENISVQQQFKIHCMMGKRVRPLHEEVGSSLLQEVNLCK